MRVACRRVDSGSFSDESGFGVPLVVLYTSAGGLAEGRKGGFVGGMQ